MWKRENHYIWGNFFTNLEAKNQLGKKLRKLQLGINEVVESDDLNKEAEDIQRPEEAAKVIKR